MITSVAAYINYFESVRRRTVNYVQTIPPEHIDWTPGEGRFSCGDLVRHIASAELMFVGVAMTGEWHYQDHAPTTETRTLEGVIAYLHTMHTRTMERLATLPDDALAIPQPGPQDDSRPIQAWRWLMLMAEHEIHHRSDLASYLTQMGYQPPQIYGLSFEELSSLAQD